MQTMFIQNRYPTYRQATQEELAKVVHTIDLPNTKPYIIWETLEEQPNFVAIYDNFGNSLYLTFKGEFTRKLIKAKQHTKGEAEKLVAQLRKLNIIADLQTCSKIMHL